ncbi:biliverdin-producing heme oxygenase [Rhodoplanes sp. TEM]|uniref:Biliverdin-producing heme oxygenase n=1 Tax=Rhodoplanes tepidamans TaxID=200616 RepID=A0ABT5JFF7_RHOTP|nr:MULTISPECIES: biliverdin-producing heme oxygenase [Rhodoplanes]MDC7788029.1 biliverdin-producing heme oxygenase [Rhodoplanes tepidamans]MDC7988152.1 biliverdin-producing heme oxygenase [Rhodoplanes sp. TEM]MDQ0353982.1 heme oxygenase [Rhodoplanes tepidamans]
MSSASPSDTSPSDTSAPAPASRWRRLQAATDAVHRALDARIMMGDPFRDRDRYARFLAMQLQIFRDVDVLYADPALIAVFPDLRERRRLHLAEQDAHDLGLDAAPLAAPALAAPVDAPTGMGWLYVIEGADLGSPFLLQETIKIGIDEAFGARHMRGHPQGRGLHWRHFTEALDAVTLSEAEEARVVAGAEAAFARVNRLFEAAGLADPPPRG